MAKDLKRNALFRKLKSHFTRLGQDINIKTPRVNGVSLWMRISEMAVNPSLHTIWIV